MKFTALITWLSTCAYQVLRSPLHLKKEKPLIDGSSELLNTKEDESAENQPEHQPRGRRSPDLKKERQSLADAGTSWTSGVRRSQRIRSRPLKFWKGERFSLKPDTSQPSTTLEPIFQYDQLQNEKFENTKKEIKRQRGGAIRNPSTQDSEQESVILNDSQDEKFADAGTSLKSGVRRSQRIRSRPLKFWEGERFLYGKVNNNSKPALIGLKYIPDGKTDFKVVSFVSNEHKELLDFAARH